jgi:hypothetical protein
MQSSFFTLEGFEAQGLGDSRAGNQPTPPSVRYPGGVRPSKGPRRFLFRLSIVLGASAPRPAGRRVRDVQLGRTAELVSIVARRGRAVVAQGGTLIALDHPGTIFVRHRTRPNAAGCQARDNEQTDEYLHGSSQASCCDARLPTTHPSMRSKPARGIAPELPCGCREASYFPSMRMNVALSGKQLNSR